MSTHEFSCMMARRPQLPAKTALRGQGAFVQTRMEDAFAALSNIKDAQFFGVSNHPCNRKSGSAAGGFLVSMRNGSTGHARGQSTLPSRRIAVVFTCDVHLGSELTRLGFLLGVRSIRVHVFSTLGIEPDVRRAVVDHLHLVEVKIGMPFLSAWCQSLPLWRCCRLIGSGRVKKRPTISSEADRI